MFMYKGYKIRLYPTKEQKEKISLHFDACRVLWNHLLSKQQELYKTEKGYMHKFELTSYLTELKKDEKFSWLNDVSCSTLQLVCFDLDNAFGRFFKKISGFPKFKRKSTWKDSYPVCYSKMYFKKPFVQIQKIGKIKYKTDLCLPQGKDVKFTNNVRLLFENNKYFLAFQLEEPSTPAELSEYSMGIDLGVKELATVAFGDKKIVYHNINKSEKIRSINRRINFYFHEAARKRRNNKKYSNNLKTVESKIRKLYKRRTDIITNYLHQITHELIEMKPKKVVMETLDVKQMIQEQLNAKPIVDECFSKFIDFMKYKCEKYNITFIQADQFYPSSKTCSYCGNIKHDLKLSERLYICEACGLKIDRDYNAALNLMKYEVH